MDVGAHGVQIVIAKLLYFCDIIVADELAVLVVMSRRERHDLIAHAHQILRLAGKDDHALLVIAVVQRADTDRVSGGDELLRLAVKQDQGILRVQHFEHLHAVLLVQRQQDLTVGAAAEGIALFQQLGLAGLIAVDLTVADHIAAIHLEGLHPLRRQAHDGQTVKAQQAVAGVYDAAVVGAAGDRFHKALGKRGGIGTNVTITHNRTHFMILQIL